MPKIRVPSHIQENVFVSDRSLAELSLEQSKQSISDMLRLQPQDNKEGSGDERGRDAGQRKLIYESTGVYCH